MFEDGELLSGGNFHGQSVAMALDFLAIALTNLATMAERRIDRLVHPDLNEGLPPFLTRDAGVHSGFMMAQVTAASLASECKVLSHPASVDTIPTDGSKEDVVPMAMAAAWKLRRIVRNVRYVLAIELMCAAQGLDYRAPLRPGRGVGARRTRRCARFVPPLERDRVLSPDIERLARGDRGRRDFTFNAMAVLMAVDDHRTRCRAGARGARTIRAPRGTALSLQGLAAGSRAAHADEQSRPRCRRAARRSRRLRRHGAGGAELGGVRRHRRALRGSRTMRRCSCRAASRSACSARTRTRRAC